MENVTFIEIEQINGLQVYAIIDNGDGSFTSMPKSTYDAMIAEDTNDNI
jgi:hypothetical protein